MLPDIWDDSYKTILPQEGGSSYPVDVPAATVDAKGALLSPTRSGTVLHLGAEDIARIAKATFIRVRMIFRTPGTAPVIFQSNNYLTVRVYAALDVSSKIAGN
jgi:hypothetical protein